MPDQATLQARLDEAETALHALLTGRREVSVGYDGRTVTYARTDVGALQAYIAELKSRLGMRRAAAIGMVF